MLLLLGRATQQCLTGRCVVEDLDKRLEAATRRRDTLVAECRRLEGKLEAAETALAAVEAECRSKGIDPDKIDNVIQQLTARYEALVVQIERDVAAADEALAPFLKET